MGLTARLGMNGSKKATNGNEIFDSAFMRRNNQNPFVADTVSEINDNKAKNTIFKHSLKHGLFNDIR